MDAPGKRLPSAKDARPFGKRFLPSGVCFLIFPQKQMINFG
jgi:hypothetical protein